MFEGERELGGGLWIIVKEMKGAAGNNSRILKPVNGL